jgi:hypothetical protein
MKGLYYIILAGVILITSACLKNTKDSDAVQAAINKRLEERFEDYKRIRLKRCMEDVLEEANLIVDSIMLLEARMAKDTLYKPLRPDKPEKPEIKTILDTLPIAPILTPEQVDSLRRRDSLGE